MAEALKDSKTRWLGQIPTNWDMVRVKDCFDRKNKKANQKDPIVLSLARSGVKIRDITSNEGQLAANYTNYNPVAKDDILINPMDLVSGDNCNISKVEGVISPAYVNLRYKKGINPRFYNYYFKLQYWLGAFFAHGYGVSFDNRWTMSYETLSKYPIVLPPSEEQDKIADFLDEKCAEIDKLSEDIQKQIDILNNYKKSVITRAVTKGLNPNAEMKDSGIKWIGYVSISHPIIRLKYIADILDKFRKPIEASERKQDSDVLYPYFGASGQIDVIDGYTIDDHVLLVGEDGANLKMRNLPLVYESKGKAWINNHAHIVKPKTNCDFYYLFYALESLDINPYITGSAQPKFNQEKLINMWVPFPDLIAQKEISTFLDDKCKKINESIKLKHNQLEKLFKYKQSIIYEYVTGKKRVS